ncbi:MAG: hypothetical protein AAGA69_08240, partial [Pseudomonadota bacterium]
QDDDRCDRGAGGMSGPINNEGDLADFIERWMRGQLGKWELDDFECISFAKKPGNTNWILECWRWCILSTAQAEWPPKGRYEHPNARPQLEKLMEVLRYIHTCQEEEAKERAKIRAEIQAELRDENT